MRFADEESAVSHQKDHSQARALHFARKWLKNARAKKAAREGSDEATPLLINRDEREEADSVGSPKKPKLDPNDLAKEVCEWSSLFDCFSVPSSVRFVARGSGGRS